MNVDVKHVMLSKLCYTKAHEETAIVWPTSKQLVLIGFEDKLEQILFWAPW